MALQADAIWVSLGVWLVLLSLPFLINIVFERKKPVFAGAGIVLFIAAILCFLVGIGLGADLNTIFTREDTLILLTALTVVLLILQIVMVARTRFIDVRAAAVSLLITGISAAFIIANLYIVHLGL
jgi:hypothetical protein